MTIPEAVELVIQTGAMGKHKDIFMLDMGEPMKVIDLAKDMIKLSGFTEEEIEIRIVGTRKGEKLEEILVGKNETLIKTPHPKILLVKFDADHIHREKLSGEVQELMKSAIQMDADTIREILTRLVPEYRNQTMENPE